MPVISKSVPIAQGLILIIWDYNTHAGRETLNRNPPVDVVVPVLGVVAGDYV